MSATVNVPVNPANAAQGNRVLATEHRSNRWVSALNAIPNIVVFSLLGGVLILGHRTGWKMPKIAQVLGEAPQPATDWCAKHLVPESQCIECKPELFPKHKPLGFCKEHGVAECVIHHPELAQLKDEPQPPKYNTVQAISVMARPENNSRNTLHTRFVQLASVESFEKSGIEVDVVQERPMTDAIMANGELVFDPTRVAHLSTRVPGTIAVVQKTIGDAVQPGEIMALVDAAQVGQAKSQLLQAIVQIQVRKSTVERLREIAKAGVVAQKSFFEAEAALQEAEIAFISARQALTNLGFELPGELETKNAKRFADDLLFLGIPTSLIATFPTGMKTANLIPVRAPFSGTVLASEVVAGEVVDASKMLFTVADPRQLWLLLNVRQEDAKYLALGLPVTFRTDDSSQEIVGNVTWISPAVDMHTRTLKVRVALTNADGKLRDKTFGMGRILLREEPNAIVVPQSAVQSTPDAHFVFVRDKHYFEKDAPKVFHVRQVRMGAKDSQYVELLAGVLPGEVVATKGSSQLLAHLLRGNLGAGCGCGDD